MTEETITIWYNGRNITMWKFVYDAMMGCKGG